MAQHRIGDVDHVARKAQHDGARRGRIGRKLVRHHRAGSDVDRVEQAQHQFGVVGFLIERMGGLLDVEIGEHARERRPRVDAALTRKIVQSVEIGGTLSRHRSARLWICCKLSCAR